MDLLVEKLIPKVLMPDAWQIKFTAPQYILNLLEKTGDSYLYRTLDDLLRMLKIVFNVFNKNGKIRLNTLTEIEEIIHFIQESLDRYSRSECMLSAEYVSPRTGAHNECGIYIFIWRCNYN